MTVDYSVFDPFIQRDTWHTFHPIDEKAFHQCLDKVVRDQTFSSEAMGEYFRRQRHIDSGSPFADDVDKLVSKAWTVRDHLQANGQL